MFRQSNGDFFKVQIFSQRKKKKTGKQKSCDFMNSENNCNIKKLPSTSITRAQRAPYNKYTINMLSVKKSLLNI